MAILNERTDKTKRVIHLLVTPLCNRNCKYCCNKQYDMASIPVVTDEELREAEVLCLTGGEPFAFTDPCEIAQYYKSKYCNIKKVYVYTNAKELAYYLRIHEMLLGINGLNISIKNIDDAAAFVLDIRDNPFCNFDFYDNRLYIFDNMLNESDIKGHYQVIHREWQEDFKPADDSIFRRM